MRQLLGREAGGVGQAREGALERAVVDLGDHPQRDGVRAVVAGDQAEVSAGILVVPPRDPVVPVHQQADLLDARADADQRRLRRSRAGGPTGTTLGLFAAALP